jgi:hypothetical protein
MSVKQNQKRASVRVSLELRPPNVFLLLAKSPELECYRIINVTERRDRTPLPAALVCR